MSQYPVSEDRVLPEWATGVMSTRTQGALSSETSFQKVAVYEETVDQETQFPIVRSTGLYVVELDAGITQSRFTAAVHLARRLMSHPPDLAAFAFPVGIRLTGTLEGKLAKLGIFVVEGDGTAPHDRAVNFVLRFLAPRDEGIQHLYRFATHSRRDFNVERDGH